MSGCVYFIADSGGRFKIGFSSDFQSRLAALQAVNGGELELLGTIPGDIPLEREMQRRFRRWHIHGEWFAGTDEALSELGRVLADPPAAAGLLRGERRVRGTEQIELAERIRRFLLDLHPVKTAENVASDLSIGSNTVRKWLAGESLPRGEMIPVFAVVYGPRFLSAVLRPVPDWVTKAVHRARRDEIIAELAALEAELAEINAALGDGSDEAPATGGRAPSEDRS